MKIIVRPSVIEGSLQANPSKSYMQRALALTGLSGQAMTIFNPCKSADSLAAMNIVQNMGFRASIEEDSIQMIPSPEHFKSQWHAGESGLSARMFSIIAAISDREITITGEGSLLSRPVKMSENILRQLGVSVISNQGFLPLRIKGPITQTRLKVDAEKSSQALSGLLIALPFGQKDADIRLIGLKSRPYVEMTLEMLSRFGIEVWHQDLMHFKIKGRQQINIDQFTIEGDWSGGAFALVAGAVAGKCTLDMLNPYSAQGDKNILDVLEKCGAQIETHETGISISKNTLEAFEYNAEDTPDLFPPLVALAANCEGTSIIHGISRLLHKESNRFEALQKEFGQLNINIQKKGDSMFVHGGLIKGANVFTHHDHRIAMALFIAGLQSESPVIIDGMECVSKSYPGFLADMTRLKADYSILEP